MCCHLAGLIYVLLVAASCKSVSVAQAKRVPVLSLFQQSRLGQPEPQPNAFKVWLPVIPSHSSQNPRCNIPRLRPWVPPGGPAPPRARAAERAGVIYSSFEGLLGCCVMMASPCGARATVAVVTGDAPLGNPATAAVMT
jgi:hypothetical protein